MCWQARLSRLACCPSQGESARKQALPEVRARVARVASHGLTHKNKFSVCFHCQLATRKWVRQAAVSSGLRLSPRLPHAGLGLTVVDHPPLFRIRQGL